MTAGGPADGPPEPILLPHRLPLDHPAYSPRRSLLPITRLYCHAPARGASRVGDPCRGFLGDVPGVASFVTTARRPPREPDGTIWLRCAECGAFNRFEVVPFGLPYLDGDPPALAPDRPAPAKRVNPRALAARRRAYPEKP